MSGISSYFRCHPKETNFWKISFNINNRNEKQHLKNLNGVLKYNAEIDIEEFLILPKEKQKLEILNFTLKQLEIIFNFYSLGKIQADEIRSYVISRGYKSYFSGPTAKHGSLSARVVCEQNFEFSRIYLEIKKEKVIIKTFDLFKSSPEEFIFNLYLQEPEWISNSQVKICVPNGDTFNIDIK
ncbi:MAG: hypothetical protein MRY72_12895 [Aquisalinus sp.]|nr:hypothetical protein [Aquisalinus sp.]